ncbi:hypothetical protein AAEO56_14900 [Flavobacterium sp. DGU11]|uniref:Immunity protein 50 n=1 Tax=Flavobacterium arundinis TaxID=3139143 RepID=A0ABU9I019_9FLAO
MIETLKELENKDAIIEIGNKERSACKLISVEEADGTTKLNLESIFPVRELNVNPSNPWEIALSQAAFGKNYSFFVVGDVQFISSQEIVFTERDRNLEIKLDFSEGTVKSTMLKYIDALIPKG